MSPYFIVEEFIPNQTTLLGRGTETTAKSRLNPLFKLKCELDSWDWDSFDVVHRNLISVDKMMNDLSRQDQCTSPESNLIQPFHGEIQFSLCYQNQLTSGKSVFEHVPDYDAILTGPKITVHIQRAFHLSPQQSEVLIPMLLVKLCPNGMKFRAQTAKQATLDPIFDKKFSFLVYMRFVHFIEN